MSLPVNKKRSTEYMNQYNLDAIIVTSPVNVEYLTGYRCWLDPILKEYMVKPGASNNLLPSYAILTKDQKTALIVNSIFGINSSHLDIDFLFLYGSSFTEKYQSVSAFPANLNNIYLALNSINGSVEYSNALFTAINEIGLKNSRIGIEADSIPLNDLDKFKETFPGAQIKDCSNLIRLIRMVKSSNEIERLIKSSQINEEAGMKSLKSAEADTSIMEMIQCYRHSISVHSADFDHYAFGIKGMGIATEPDYRLDKNDCMYIDFGCRYQSYYSDSGTTLITSKTNKKFENYYNLLNECLLAGQDILKPGIACSKIQLKMADVLKKQGIEKSFPHGHGIGLEVRDYPIIVPNNNLNIKDDCVDIPSDLKIEENMVLNLEVSLFELGAYSLNIEKTFIITKTGCKPLIEQCRNKPFLQNN